MRNWILIEKQKLFKKENNQKLYFYTTRYQLKRKRRLKKENIYKNCLKKNFIKIIFK